MNMAHGSNANAEKEKRDAAFTSVVAAVLLTGLKLGIGLLTGRTKEAVLAINVQANMNGITGSRKRVTKA